MEWPWLDEKTVKMLMKMTATANNQQVRWITLQKRNQNLVLNFLTDLRRCLNALEYHKELKNSKESSNCY